MMTSFVFGALLISGAFAVEFSYDAQQDWPEICVTGNQMRQSPIDIITAGVEENKNLIALDLDGWDTEYDGVFENTGHNVQFNPATAGLATTGTHLGTYEVQQFHMHWGNTTGEGSEHRINGEQAELEIHFVQYKRDETDMTAGDFAAVVSVLADVDADAPITGPWEQLSAMAVQPYKSNVSVENFRYDQLLPENLDYWYYEGSLTTPLCSEIVVWFVLQNRITVPGAYLEQLRAVQENEQGALLTFNFRMAQDLAGRRVTVRDSGATPTVRAVPITSLLVAVLVLSKQFY